MSRGKKFRFRCFKRASAPQALQGTQVFAWLEDVVQSQRQQGQQQQQPGQPGQQQQFRAQRDQQRRLRHHSRAQRGPGLPPPTT